MECQRQDEYTDERTCLRCGKPLLVRARSGAEIPLDVLFILRTLNIDFHEELMFSPQPKLYGEALPDIRDGDIALFRAGWRPSNLLIARVGSTPYCHAGMIHRTAWSTLLLLEMIQWHGGRSTPFAGQVQGWPGQWDIYRPYGEYDGEDAVRIMASFVDEPYGRWNLAVCALRHTRFLRLLLPPLTDDNLDGSAPFCSQAVSRACRLGGGVDPRLGHADIATEPGHLADPNFAEYLMTVYWDKLPEVVT